MNMRDEHQATIEQIVQRGKSILATDESHPTIRKRFIPIEVDCTEESRRA